MHVPVGRLGTSPFDAFIFNGDHVFNTGRLGGPLCRFAKTLREKGTIWFDGGAGITAYAILLSLTEVSEL